MGDMEDREMDFQEVIGKFITKMGFEVDSTEPLMDGSVDFKAKTTNPMGGKVLSLIRASSFSRLVNEDDIGSLHDRMEDIGAVRSAYITTSGFTNEAVETAKDKPISLINKYQLMESISRRGLASDKDLMESLERYGMAEKYFQGYEQSFVNGRSDSEAREYFESKAKKGENPVRIRLRYAPVSVLNVRTTKDVWTRDQTLRTIEKKDYLFINLTNMDLYYVMQKRKKNRTENRLMRSDIIRKINDLPEYSKEHLLHLLEHGDLPVEDLEGKELSILKNKKVINIYEGRKGGAGTLMEYAEMFLEGLIETINMLIDEIVSGIGSMGEGGRERPEEKPPKKVTAEVNMPHLYGGKYDIWKYLEVEKGIKSYAEVDPIVYSSTEVGKLLKSIFNGTVKKEGLIFLPYYRAKYVDQRSNRTKYEILVAPNFKGEEAPEKKRDVRKGPRIKAKKKPLAGDFKLIK